MSRIVLYADAGADVGMGHIFRLYSIFNYLKKSDIPVEMLVPLPQANLLDIGAVGCTSFLKEPDEIANTLRALNPIGVLIDTYRFRYQFFRFHKIQVNMWMGLFDDHLDLTERVTFLINASPAVSASDYTPGVASHFLLGSLYASLSQAFLKSRKHFTIRPQIQKVLVALGGSDTMNNLPILATTLHQILDKSVEIDVLGMAGINDFTPPRLKFFHWLKHEDLAERMFSYDLAILSGGTMLLQAACVGVPTIAWPQTKQQVNHAKTLEKQGVVMSIINLNQINGCLSMLHSEQNRKRFSEKAKALIDGGGAKRIADFLISME